MSNITHKCSVCEQEFATEQAYLDHVCPQTEKQPTDPAHLGPEFAEISKAALERGEARKDEEFHPAVAAEHGSKSAARRVKIQKGSKKSKK